MQCLERDGAFLDVGANIGYYSLLASTRVPNAELCPVAASSRDGDAVLVLGENCVVSYVTAAANDTIPHVVTPTVTLDRFVDDRGIAVTGIKIDAEGHDMAVLQGARRLLATQHPVVLTEFNADEAGTNSPEALRELVSAAGYRIYALAHPRSVERNLCEWRRPPRLRRIDERNVLEHVVKMFFLVPGRLWDFFDEREGRRGHD